MSFRKEPKRKRGEEEERRSQSMVYHVYCFLNFFVTRLGGDTIARRNSKQQAEQEKEVTVKVEKEEGVPSYRREM